MYPEDIVLRMKLELTNNGFKDIIEPKLVEENIKNYTTTLFFINSVCGCSASSARPGILMSLQNKIIPDNLATVFAGYDFESTKKLREFLLPFPPSSPFIVFFKYGKIKFALERHHIEGQTAESICKNLKEVYNKHCTSSNHNN